MWNHMNLKLSSARPAFPTGVAEDLLPIISVFIEVLFQICLQIKCIPTFCCLAICALRRYFVRNYFTTVWTSTRQLLWVLYEPEEWKTWSFAFTFHKWVVFHSQGVLYHDDEWFFTGSALVQFVSLVSQNSPESSVARSTRVQDSNSVWPRIISCHQGCFFLSSSHIQRTWWCNIYPGTLVILSFFKNLLTLVLSADLKRVHR